MQIMLGLTDLRANIPGVTACLGEDVTFTCTTASFNLRWTVTTQNPAVQPKIVSFRSSTTPGNPINITDDGLQLHFQFMSFSAIPRNLTSILIARASAGLNHAIIECSGSSVKRLSFRIISGELYSFLIEFA